MRLVDSRLLKRTLVTVYLITLPVFGLVALGSFNTAIHTQQPESWVMFTACATVVALILWRLVASRTSFGFSSSPSPSRRTSLMLALGFLAVAGLATVVLGLSWIGIGVWINFEPVLSRRLELEMGYAVEAQTAFLLIVGALAIGIGLLAAWPFWRIWRTSPAPMLPAESTGGVGDNNHD